ncbi:Sphingoid long-chain base transporter RSB1 [Grifola frondosa]|uniref:Sphingoid long-chain base transporter RSB1 n=1 Tax=Grifola frondosa TaxID=5627 RepID=A0A1C7MKX5_GRIFR|nr:Sphingoid long-chain base transporter RSB1 [Grifola frondosa]
MAPSNATVLASIKDEMDSPYNYVPTEWICILFIVLFGLSTAIHVVQSFCSRLWWLFGTAVLAGIAEVIGWSGRLWSSLNPPLLDPFLMQWVIIISDDVFLQYEVHRITTTIIAPTPLVAANFVILGQITRRLGQNYSRLSATWYTIVFGSCDIIALVIQAVGGAKASVAVENGNDPGPGGHIMLAGIAFQLAAISIYMILAAEFLLRYTFDKPVRHNSQAHMRAYKMDRNVKLMIFGLAFSSTVIFIRSVYRTAVCTKPQFTPAFANANFKELTDGWSGRIISTQVYFNVLDGAMIVLAMVSLNLFHPGWLLGTANKWNNNIPMYDMEISDDAEERTLSDVLPFKKEEIS